MNLTPYCLRLRLALALTLLSTRSASLLATLPEPDAVIYGAIALDGRTVNPATDPNLVVEARRSRDGTLLARHRLGDDSAAGPAIYVLRVPMETAPASAPTIASVGDELRILVLDPTGERFQATITLTAAGHPWRLDFGVTADAGGNGLPDDWEVRHFGLANVDPFADADADGHSNLEEYVSGTQPLLADSQLTLHIVPDANGLRVSFLAQRAAGVGYDFRHRFYALEVAAHPAGDWQPVPNLSRVVGADQVVTCLDSDLRNPAVFFRVRAWLEGP